MARAEVSAAIDSEGEPSLRILSGTRGSAAAGDVLILAHDAMHPHPTYFTMFVDDALTSVVTRGRAEQCRLFERPLTCADVEELIKNLRDQRVPLAWADLEVIDAPEQSQRPNPTTVAIVTIICMPPVWAVIPLLPVMIPLTIWLEGDGPERRAARKAALLALPDDADRPAVFAAIGMPQRLEKLAADPDIELWTYWDAGLHVGCRVAFVRGRVLWIDFDYYEWQS